jgi:hypothetical protein
MYCGSCDFLFVAFVVVSPKEIEATRKWIHDRLRRIDRYKELRRIPSRVLAVLRSLFQPSATWYRRQKETK